MAADNMRASTVPFGKQPPRVTFVIARADNGVIGINGKLPWHIPAGLQHFKTKTLGKPVIMGRKTFESIGRPLPRRTNIVVTINPNFQAKGIVVVNDAKQALALAYEECHRTGADEIAVIGGGEIAKVFLPDADRIYLTEVHRRFAGDTAFNFCRDDWRESARQDFDATGDSPAFSFVILNRVKGKSGTCS